MTHDEEVKITSHSIKEMLDTVQADKDARKVFLAMPREEQLLAILGMITYTNSLLANLQKEQIDQRRDIEDFKEELRHSRNERQQMEKDLAEKLGVDIKFTRPDGDSMSTTEKVMAVIAKRFDFWRPVLQNSLSVIINIIVLALLYMAFGGKVP